MREQIICHICVHYSSNGISPSPFQSLRVACYRYSVKLVEIMTVTDRLHESSVWARKKSTTPSLLYIILYIFLMRVGDGALVSLVFFNREQSHVDGKNPQFAVFLAFNDREDFALMAHLNLQPLLVYQYHNKDPLTIVFVLWI